MRLFFQFVLASYFFPGVVVVLFFSFFGSHCFANYFPILYDDSNVLKVLYIYIWIHMHVYTYHMSFILFLA
eukprot:NODE_1997_length_853_cov_142.333333_g1400_i0.p2 GENE.NODE_1997_length_853_cov_142.333333_g1400_i0~~NODE_1997_length_853_cov_142.333333_g1400_i0.p2  ORF type:complete len:71 (+),score=5.93 NODE_1997_length_853_cov_142.333333_g1400_i0:249-461(+)